MEKPVQNRGGNGRTWPFFDDILEKSLKDGQNSLELKFKIVNSYC